MDGIGLEAAGGKNLGVCSPTIGAQLLDRALIDDLDQYNAAILLCQRIRLYHNPGREPVDLHRTDTDDRPRSSAFVTDHT